MARLVSFIVLAAIVVLFGVLFFQVMAQFLLPMFLAVIFVVMFRPVHQWFILKCGGRVRTAAGITTLVILLIVLVPMLSILTIAASEGTALLTQLNSEVLLSKVTKLRHRLGLDLGLPVAEVKETLPNIEKELERLEAVLIVGSTDEELQELRDQTVPQLIDNLKRLRTKTSEMPVPTAGPKSDQPDPEAVAEKRADLEMLSQLMALVKSLRLERVDDGIAPEPPAQEPGVAQDVAQIKELYYRYKQRVVGGPLLENLRLQANPNKAELKDVRARIEEWIGSYLLSTGQFLGGIAASIGIGLFVLVISLYYFLADGPAMVATIMRLLPLDDRYERQLLDEFDRISRAVVLATLLAAFVQGVLAGIGFYIAGIQAVFLLMVLTMILALVPFVGAAAVWGSCSLWLLFYEERTAAAVILALYGVGVISMADNVIKPMVLHGQSKLHPLLALLSVLGGLRALGPIGIFVGPMAVAFLQALLNILNTELSAFTQRLPTVGAPAPE